VTTRRRLGGSASLKRRTTPRAPEPIRPEDYATADNPIGVCRSCQHHTSAWIGGSCTAVVLDGQGIPRDCGCNCREHLNGDAT